MNGNKLSLVIIASVIVLGLVGGAFVLGNALKGFRKDDRYVTVKGFSEREVKADLAVWPIKVEIASNVLADGSKEIEAAKNKVVQFLSANGFNAQEIIQKDLRVTDRQANQYGSSDLNDMMRYIIEVTVLVRSTDVDKVEKVSRMTDDLVRAGVVLSTANEWQGTGPRFLFTKLNDVKPDMLAEATRNAQTAGNQFAKESASRLGSIRKATQGLFSITDRDDFFAGQAESGGYASGTTDSYKRIRVVVTVDYFLE